MNKQIKPAGLDDNKLPMDSENSDAEVYVSRKPRLCVIAGFHSPSFSGRVGGELLAASRGLELALAASEIPCYPHQKEFPVAPIVAKVLKRPESGRYRLYVMPFYAMPESVEQGEMWAIGSFDANSPDPKQLKKLKKLVKVWVPSTAHEKACVKAGVPRDSVNVFPIPVNLRTFHPRVPCPPQYAPAKGWFRFIVSASPLKRKGIEDVLQAFIKEFRPEEKVELVIKLTNYPRPKKDFLYEIADLRKKLGALNNLFAKVTVIAETLADLEYAGLLASADAYVAASCSFNSGITVREAMACALPVIGPDFLAELTGLSSESGYLLPTVSHKLLPGEQYVNSPACQARRIPLEELSKTMREAFTCCNKSRKMGLVGQRYLKNQPEWKDLGRELMQFANQRFSSQQPEMAE